MSHRSEIEERRRMMGDHTNQFPVALKDTKFDTKIDGLVKSR